jgi:hypothetical protein
MAETNINFVLSHFDASFTLDASAQLLEGEIPGLDVSAVAIYEVKVGVFRDVFRYWSDASDVDGLLSEENSDPSNTDVKYYVKLENWPSEVIINPAHAVLEYSQTVNGVAHASSGEVATGYTGTGRNLVKHDFLRYIAKNLFNTHLGVDLFTNEGEMAFNIAKQGDLYGWGSNPDAVGAEKSIWKTLVDASNGTNNSGYYNNDISGSANLTRELLKQLNGTSQGRDRLANIEADGVRYNDGTYPIPFVAGDSVSMKVTLHAAEGQEVLTGVSAIPPRPYQIKVVLVADDATLNNIIPNDALLNDGTNDVAASYVASHDQVTTAV